MKRILIVVTLLMLVLVVGGWVAAPALLRAGIENGAASALRVEAHLGAASLAPFSGRVTLSGLWLGNPPGFRAPRSLAAERIELTVAVRSLLADTVIVERVDVRAPEIVLETDFARSNLGALAENARKGGDATAGAPPTGAAPPDPATSGRKLRIAELRISGARVNVVQTALGRASATVALPDIVLHDVGIGGGEDSATVSKVLDAVLQAILKGIGGVADQLPAELRNVATTIDRELGLAAKQLGEGLEGAVRNAGREIEQGIGGAAKQIEKVFK